MQSSERYWIGERTSIPTLDFAVLDRECDAGMNREWPLNSSCYLALVILPVLYYIICMV
jgi:hypothetical protein